MIDYKDYFIIQGYIKKGDMESLKAYLEKEKKKYYLKEAKEALLEYVRGYRESLYEYVDDKLVISDGYTGFYILNSDELLSAQIRKDCGGYINEPDAIMKRKINLMIQAKAALDENHEMASNATFRIGKVTTDKFNKKMIVIKSEDSKISQFFNKRLYEESLKILGEETSITINEDVNKPVFVAKSPKGLCITLGIKRDD